MSAIQKPDPPISAIYWLCRGVFIESIRRREISVVLLFMGLFIVGAVVARFVGAETDAAAVFILNLGISLAWILSLIVAVLMAARQFPDELEKRLIYPLLAKPIARYQYILGKWLATILASGATAIVLNLLALAASPWPEHLSVLAFAQTLLLELTAIATAAAIAIALSIRAPKAVAVVVTVLLVFAAGPIITMTQSLVAASPMRSVILWVIGYIPNFSKLDMVNTFSAGTQGITGGDFLARIIYAAIISLFALTASMLMLERKPL